MLVGEIINSRPPHRKPEMSENCSKIIRFIVLSALSDKVFWIFSSEIVNYNFLTFSSVETAVECDMHR